MHKKQKIILIVFYYIIKLITCSTLDLYKNARLGHRIVQTRYGRLHGLILPLDNYRFLRSVEAFLGVPYATPPTKSNSEIDRISKLYFGKTAAPLTFERVGGHTKIENNGKYPYIAALEFKGSHICGSAIIDKDVVITAAHCVRDRSPKDLQVRAGSFQLGDTNSAIVQVRNIYKIISHENVKFENSKPWEFDIALLLLNKKFKLNEFVNVIQLADIDLRNSAYGESVTLLGWGLTEKSVKSRFLLKADATLLAQSVCQKKAIPGERITSNMVCTLNKDKSGACKGDSGGPLITRKDDTDKLIGITCSAVLFSLNRKCDTTYPSVYADVAALQPWIVQKLVKVILEMRKIRDSWLKRVPFIKT